ncbi:MAG: winged helix-turn-helix domain-containing protein, partial [Elusimicrobia bacterium]|nr:winged helix-turn-helix domain-containing protein [Elusimicrobiota bacterium]
RAAEPAPLARLLPPAGKTGTVSRRGGYMKFKECKTLDAVPKETPQKTREKTREKILSLIKSHPTITTSALAKALKITAKGVEWNLKGLKADGIIVRVGPDKGGRWAVT